MRTAADQATEAGVDDAGKILEAQTKANIATRFKPGTGRLSDSVEREQPFAIGAHAWRTRVYPTVIYSRIQELGGVIIERRAGSKMVAAGLARNAGQFVRRDFAYPGSYLTLVKLPPRPYLSPALATSAQPMRDAVADRWAAALEV